MTDNKDIGYYEELLNGSAIVRARTIRQIRSWVFPRSLESIEALNKEFAGADFPGIYILIDTKATKVYIGEAKNIYNRLKTHITDPEDKIKHWEQVLVINDGRIAVQSDFNDNVIRMAIEIYLIKLFKLNKYTVVAQGDEQNLNGQQKSIYSSLIEELNFFLNRKGLISKFIEKRNEEEVMQDDLKKILAKHGYNIQRWRAYESQINGSRFFIRSGSKKTKGWQVTFRDKFKEALQKSAGYLLMPRGGIVIIPFAEILTVLDNKTAAFKNNTIDVFIEFTDDSKVKLNYKNNSMDITKYRLLKN